MKSVGAPFRVVTISPDISIIIVSYNTREMLRDCLASVLNETHEAKIEIFVVDNGSTDGSRQMIGQCFPQVVLIANVENRGFAAANNQAIARAAGRYFLLLNPDTVILDKAIDRTLQYADQHDNIGALGPKVLWPSGEHQSTAFRFPSLGNLLIDSSYLPWAFPKVKLFSRSRYASLDWDLEHDVNVIAGCFLMVRRDVVQEVGELDEDFFMYGEEAEWCYRIHKAGWRVVYYPGAKIIHIFGGSSKGVKESAKAQLAKRRAILLVLQKSRGTWVVWWANLIMLIGLIPRLPLWLWLDFRQKEEEIGWLTRRAPIVRFHIRSLFQPRVCAVTGRIFPSRKNVKGTHGEFMAQSKA